MISNRIYVALILCVAVVISIWLVSKRQKVLVSNSQNATVSVATPDEKTSTTTNDDWKKILSNMAETGTTTILNKNSSDNSASFDDTTLTAQMAKDFFAQYLQIARAGQDVTPEEAQKIAEKTLSLPEYTKGVGAVYTSLNLHVNSKTDIDTVKIYNNELVQNLQNRTLKTKLDPMATLADAIKTDDESGLSKLDPLIANIKAIIIDLLKIPVPADAVRQHLDLLNAYSNVLANVEAMRVTFSDPVRSFANIGQYEKHLSDLQKAISNINNYFQTSKTAL